MFWTRFKSVLVFIPIMLIMIYLGGIPFLVFVAILLGTATWEYWRLLMKTGLRPSVIILMSGVLVLFLQRVLFSFRYTDLVLAALIFLVALHSLVKYEQGNHFTIINFSLYLGGIFYLGWVGSYLVTIRSIHDGIDGRYWLLTVLPIVWLVDLGAYTLGKLLGKHKMLPRLSPHKTWEGYAGGIMFGAGAGALLSLLWHKFLPAFPAWQGALMGFVLGLLTPLGDIFISMLKREAKVKDTGNLIPGHGGVLDRIDTWIWAALIGYYVLQVFERF